MEAAEPDAVVDDDDVRELLRDDIDINDDLPRTSIFGYPTRPLCREISNIIYIWMVTKYVLLYPPYKCTYRGYYGLVVVTPRPPPCPQTFHRSHDTLKNPYRIASIFYM